MTDLYYVNTAGNLMAKGWRFGVDLDGLGYGKPPVEVASWLGCNWQDTVITGGQGVTGRDIIMQADGMQSAFEIIRMNRRDR